MTPDTEPDHFRVEGSSEFMRLDLARVAIRTRECGVTLSAWRLALSTPQGAGAIALIENAGDLFYRGEGVFLGWTQMRLASTYRSLLPAGVDPEPDPGQFG